MSSRNTASLTASWRSQSQICRWISGSVLRRRSARGGKSPPRSARAGSLLPLLPFLPHQEAVGQHHRHRVPVEASPPSAWYWSQPKSPLASSWYCSTQCRRCAYSTIASNGIPARKLLQEYLRLPSVACSPISQPRRRRPAAVVRQQRTATNRPRSQPLLPSRHVTVRHDRKGWAPIRASARCLIPP